MQNHERVDAVLVLLQGLLCELPRSLSGLRQRMLSRCDCATIVKQAVRHWDFERALSCQKHCRRASMGKVRRDGLSSLQIRRERRRGRT